MAYNIYFINKRKNCHLKQTNSSARILPLFTEKPLQCQRMPSYTEIDEGRRTGAISLKNFSLTEIPNEIYCINVANSQKVDFNGFDHFKESLWWEETLLLKLDLSFNKIKSVDSNIRLLNSLSHLNLENNAIETLPDEMKEMENLIYLNISHNNISILPVCIGALIKLQNLLVGGNKICCIPNEFCRLTSLEVLDVSYNQISSIPEIIRYFTKLQHLMLAGNKIKSLPEVIIKLKDLKILDISQNQLSNFPRAFVARFEILKLYRNMLTEFPIFEYSPSLQELNISHNKITEFSVEKVSFIPNIITLIMSNNDIKILPTETSYLESLYHLDISHNDLDSIPYELGNADSLKKLEVHGNPFRSIKRTAMTRGTDVLKEYLRTRNSKGSVYDRLPLKPYIEVIHHNNNSDKDKDNYKDYNIHDLNSTGTVNLSYRGMEIIPEQCFIALKSRKIKHFKLSYNKLSEIPTGVFLFSSSLVSLDISYNQILELPNTFSDLKSLEHLNLSGNYITSLPESIYNLNNHLLSLNLSHNPLGSNIPDIIYTLCSLQELTLSNCSIVHIDAKEFMKLKKLSKLDLSNNDIKSIPPQFGLCENIKTLNLNGNKIFQPSRIIMEQDTHSILQFLRSMIKSRPDTLK